MKKRHIVATGIGLVAPNAIGKENFWKALESGKSGIKKVSRFDVSSYPAQIAGQVDGFDPSDYAPPKVLKRTSLATQFALASAKMAIEDAKLGAKELSRAGVILGVSSSASDIIEAQHGAFIQKGLSRVSPFGVMAILPGASANNISVIYGCKGMVTTLSNSCAAGADAIGYAFRVISHGSEDIIIAGGTESQIAPFGLAMLSAPGIMSTLNSEPEKASRPFDKDRDGGVLSEGAGIVILEELEHALDRGAHIYAEIIGFASKADGASHCEWDDPDSGIKRSMVSAMADAGIEPEEVDYICAHGPSDSFDAVETTAIKSALGEHAYKIPISSIKSMIGNPLSAAGPLQLIASIMAFELGIIPPTINLAHPDDKCDLDYIPNVARKGNSINTIIINSHGFGGVNATIIIRRYRDDEHN